MSLGRAISRILRVWIAGYVACGTGSFGPCGRVLLAMFDGMLECLERCSSGGARLQPGVAPAFLQLVEHGFNPGLHRPFATARPRQQPENKPADHGQRDQ